MKRSGPSGKHRSKRPSGAQQRKAKKAKMSIIKKQVGAMLQYIKKEADDNQPGTSEDTAPLPPTESAGSSESEASSSSMHSASAEEEEKVEASSSSMHSASAEEEEKVEEAEEAEDTTDHEYASSHDKDTEHQMSDVQEKGLQMLHDVSFWEIPVQDTLRVQIVNVGNAPFQNKDGPFSVAVRPPGNNIKGWERQLSKHLFYRLMPNGQKILRSWMVYSPVSEHFYCFCCRLFTAHVTDSTSKFVTGFQKWWTLNPRVKDHERSDEHLRCLESWRALEGGLRQGRTIDADIITSRELETKKWKDILRSLLDVILFLAKQNLAFRGHLEDETSVNKGNFLEMVEVLAKHDSVLKEHLLTLKQLKATLKKDSVSYLSPTTQNEFIHALAKKVKQNLLTEIKSAKYFGIMLDSTPDISHHDQMAEVIRYVKISNRKVEVKEAFLGFFLLEGKKAADISSNILKCLEDNGLDIMMCRGQGYDNAANMAGTQGGVQAILKAKNKKAIFIGCVDHSLNLCGFHSFAENASCETFFGILESVFTFFAASTTRWAALMNHTPVSVKMLSATRWSAHYAAVKPVKENYDGLLEAMEALCAPELRPDTRGLARFLSHSVLDFTFLCYLYFWCDVLGEVDRAQQYLQTKGLGLDKVVIRLESLRLFLQKERSRLVERAIQQALLKSEEHGIEVQRRPSSKKSMAGDAGLSLQEENKRGMLQCIDRFQSELHIRSGAMREVAAMFEALQVKSLLSATEEQLKVSVPKLTTFYDEVSESELLLEIPMLRSHLRAVGINVEDAKQWGALDVLKFIAEWDFIESLPALSLSLQLFLTICVSVASCERSFSKLKLIKNYLRSTMGQARLSDLALLSVESELTQDIDFDKVIQDFAAMKVRKGKF